MMFDRPLQYYNNHLLTLYHLAILNSWISCATIHSSTDLSTDTHLLVPSFTLVIAFFKESPTELSHRHSAAIYYSYLWIIFACAFIGVSLAVGYGTRRRRSSLSSFLSHFISLLKKGVENSRTLAFGKALGIVGGICGSLMYIPQIFQTFSNKVRLDALLL